MNPIVSPWLFYIFYLCNNLNIFCSIVSVTLTILLFISLVLFPILIEELEDFSDKCKIFIKKGFIILIIAALGSIIIPNEKTLLEMTVASYATPDNINAAAGTIEDFVDITIEKVNKAVKGE